MKMPLSWLREFVDVTVEPKKLAEDLTVAGLAVDGIESHGDDSVFDFDITTNRVDAMNVYGVAREIAVLYGTPLRPPTLTFGETGASSGSALQIAIEAPELCPRFCARVLDVRMGPSPAWMRDRLEAVGVRSISNLVDLTNYVMLELGQPSHAFDLAKIPAGRLSVRWAREGEKLQTLDGIERLLGPRHGVVAGSDGALALAGVMGGASSEVSDATRTIALEAAYWEPLAIRRSAKSLGMHTEASHRFERGADPEGPLVALARIAHLLEKIGAGTVRPGLIDVHPSQRPARSATLRFRQLRTVLGTEVAPERAEEILKGLGFVVVRRDAEALSVAIPTWRGDVNREVDLIEEVGRHHGLGRVPSRVPPARGAEGLRPYQARERILREVLVGAGLSEVISHAFVSRTASAALGQQQVALENPLSEAQEVLRGSLAVPGLIAALATNERQGRRDVRLYEIGRVFVPDAGLPREERRMAVLLAGAAAPHWSEKPRSVDVFDVKGILEAVARRLGLGTLRVERDGAPGFLHPGQSGLVFRGEQQIGWFGALHPDLVAERDLRNGACVAELLLDDILMQVPPPTRVLPLPRFPEVTRDLSILADASLPERELESRILGAGGDLLRSVTLVDLYQGPPVPAGKVSLTVTLRFQHPERTLTGEEVQAAVEAVVRALKSAGAEIRGE
jgi:phenylalanyl-tRNA synthetase beta chain